MPARLDKASLLVVDPIDGTRAFLAGDPRWTVSIALVLDGRPIAGVVHAPALWGDLRRRSRLRGERRRRADPRRGAADARRARWSAGPNR